MLMQVPPNAGPLDDRYLHPSTGEALRERRSGLSRSDDDRVVLDHGGTHVFNRDFALNLVPRRSSSQSGESSLR